MPDQSPKVPRLKTDNKKRARPLTTSQRGYDTKHQKLSKERRALHPICEVCNNAWAVDAHHIVYPARSVECYRSLCRSCHNKLTHG